MEPDPEMQLGIRRWSSSCIIQTCIPAAGLDSLHICGMVRPQWQESPQAGIEKRAPARVLDCLVTFGPVDKTEDIHSPT